MRPLASTPVRRLRLPFNERSAPSRSVLCIAHSPEAAIRAGQLLAEVPGVEIVKPPPGPRGAVIAAWRALSSRAGVLYLIDVGKTTTVAAVLGRLTRKRVILDIGDATFALARSVGGRSFLGLALVGIGEQLALHSAHQIVVRGRAHAELVPRPATHIPDLPSIDARPSSATALRTELGLEGAFVVGLVGSLNFAPRLGTSYGWDLIEALPDTTPEVVAMIVGDGTGLEPLRERARRLGVIERCRFVGRVPFDQVAEYIGTMNAAISTQTNNVVGQVRTTGKLPLYLACGCPVLASHVGEAARLLGPLGWTVSYNGVVDLGYPARLAQAIEAWRRDTEGAPARRVLALRVARDEFSVPTMRRRLARLIAVETDLAYDPCGAVNRQS